MCGILRGGIQVYPLREHFLSARGNETAIDNHFRFIARINETEERIQNILVSFFFSFSFNFIRAAFQLSRPNCIIPLLITVITVKMTIRHFEWMLSTPFSSSSLFRLAFTIPLPGKYFFPFRLSVESEIPLAKWREQLTK